MPLSGQKALLALPVATVPAQFDLVNINGRPIPTYFAPTPGLTPNILWASLSLYEAGKALMTEHRQEVDGTETTRTANLVYRISGNQLVLSCVQAPV